MECSLWKLYKDNFLKSELNVLLSAFAGRNWHFEITAVEIVIMEHLCTLLGLIMKPCKQELCPCLLGQRFCASDTTPCPSPTPQVHSDSHPSNQWCHPAISSSVVPFSSCLQSFPASGSFPMSQFFTSGVQSIGVSALASSFQRMPRADLLQT